MDVSEVTLLARIASTGLLRVRISALSLNLGLNLNNEPHGQQYDL